MTRIVSATDARIHLGEHLHRIDGNRAITVEHDGSIETILISTTEYERLCGNTNGHEDWWALAERSREAFRENLGDRERPLAVDLIREGREERDAQILDALR